MVSWDSPTTLHGDETETCLGEDAGEFAAITICHTWNCSDYLLANKLLVS